LCYSPRFDFGPKLFNEWRYLDHGEPGKDNSSRSLSADFVLNFPHYQGAQILLARQNFGCGSSREHAPWALDDYGIRCIIASSYADIFYNNCFKNSILPIVLKKQEVQRIFKEAAETEDYHLKINLVEQHVMLPCGDIMGFEVDAFKRKCLLEGLDDIGQTLQQENQIRTYEQRRQHSKP